MSGTGVVQGLGNEHGLTQNCSQGQQSKNRGKDRMELTIGLRRCGHALAATNLPGAFLVDVTGAEETTGALKFSRRRLP